MPMIHVYHTGFDTPERVHRTINRFRSETDYVGLEVRQTLISARYPLPDANNNEETLREMAYTMQTNFIQLPKNYGQDGNFLEIVNLESNRIADNDIVVFYDTDNRPDKNTWLKDALEVFKLCPDAGFLCMNCSCTDNHVKNQGDVKIYGNVTCRVLCWPGGFPTGIYRGVFFKKGITKTRPYYGGTEYNILQSLRSHRMIGLVTVDHDDLRDVEGWDPEYCAWKSETIVKHEQLDFEEWLRIRGRLP